MELLLLRESYHMITLDRERRLLADRMATFFRNTAAAADAAIVATA